MITAALPIIDLITTDKDKKFEPAGRMAAVVIGIIQKQGSCLPQDLNAEGFSPQEVSTHWHLAHSLAATEIRLIKNQHLPNFDEGVAYA